MVSQYARRGVSTVLLLGIGLGLVLPIAGFPRRYDVDRAVLPARRSRNQFQIQLTLPSQSSIGLHARGDARAARELLLAQDQVTDVQWFLGESAPPFYYNMLANRAGIAQYAQALVQVTKSADGRRDLIRAVAVGT